MCMNGIFKSVEHEATGCSQDYLILGEKSADMSGHLYKMSAGIKINPAKIWLGN